MVRREIRVSFLYLVRPTIEPYFVFWLNWGILLPLLHQGLVKHRYKTMKLCADSSVLEFRTSVSLVCALCVVGLVCDAFGGSIITSNLPPNTAIINIDARADGSATFNGDQSLWYAPFNTGGTLLELTVPPGTYHFRAIDPADALTLFPSLTPVQTNQIYTAWTFNSPWATDYLVFDGAAATNKSLPQLFDGAFSNTNGGANTWHFYANPVDAYNASISNGFASLLRTAATGGRDSTNDISAYAFASTTTLIFAISDNGLGDNAGGVSVLVSLLVPGKALYIEQVPPSSVRLLWPTNDPAYGLQASTNLTGPGWLPAAPSPTIVGTNNVVTNSATGHRFYRLAKP